MEENGLTIVEGFNGPLADVQYTTRQKLGAEFTLNNIFGSTLAQEEGEPTFGYPADPNFNAAQYLKQMQAMDSEPWDAMKELRTWSIIQDATSAADAQQKMLADERFKRARRIQQTMGLGESLWMGGLAGMTDPIALATLAVPVLRGAQTIRSAATRLGTLATAEQASIETVLQSQQYDRTLEESIKYTLGAAIAGSVLGGIGGVVMTRAQRMAEDAKQDLALGENPWASLSEFSDPNIPIREAINAHNTGTGPAFRFQEIERQAREAWENSDPTIGPRDISYTDADEMDVALREHDVANKGFLQKLAMLKLSPINRLAANPYSLVARKIGQLINGHSALTEANKKGLTGLATPDSASTAIDSATGRFFGREMIAIKEARKAYLESLPRGAGIMQRIKGWDEMSEMIGQWMRRYDRETGDVSFIPEEHQVWAKRLMDDLDDTLQDLEGHLRLNGFMDELEDMWGYKAFDIKRVEKQLEAAKRKLAKAEAKAVEAEQKMAKAQRKVDTRNEGSPRYKEEVPLRDLETARVKAEEARKAAQSQELLDEVEVLTNTVSLLRDHHNGKIAATKVLFKRLHGEKRYITQSWIKNALRVREAEFRRILPGAQRQWFLNQIEAYGGESTAAGRRMKRQMHKFFFEDQNGKPKKGAEENIQKRIDIYLRELVENNDPSNLAGMDNIASGGVKMKQARKLRIDTTYEQDGIRMDSFLNNNYYDLRQSYYSSVFPHMELTKRGLRRNTKQFNETVKLLQDDFNMQRERASAKGDVKELNRIDKVEMQTLKDIEVMLDVLEHSNYKNISQMQRDIAFTITQFNATRQLGMMLLPSTGDSIGIIAKTMSPEIFRAIRPALKGLKSSIKDMTAEEAREAAGIVDLWSAFRMHQLQNSAEIGINQGPAARISGRISNYFYKSVGILHWNQGNKDMAVIAFGNDILKMAQDPSKMGAKKIAWFARDGIDENMLRNFYALWQRFPLQHSWDNYGLRFIDTGKIFRMYREGAENVSEIEKWMNLARTWNALLNKHADRTVVTPGVGDFPAWASRSPIARMILQYKGFGISSINKTTIPMVQGMAMGDGWASLGFLGLTLAGTTTYMLRQKMYDREISENWQTLVYEGLLRGGALGIYADALAISQETTNGWLGLADKMGVELPSRYYARGLITDVLGPSAGLIEDVGYFVDAATGYAVGEELTDRDRSKAARMIPFNNAIYLRGFLENWSNDN